MARGADFTRQREVVEAFLAASRDGYFEALLAVLDPDVVVRADRTAVPPGTSLELRAVETVARPAFTVSRRARFAQPALVNGTAGSSTPRVDVYPWQWPLRSRMGRLSKSM